MALNLPEKWTVAAPLKPERPHCLYCDKPLRKHTYFDYREEGQPDPVVLYNMQVLQITRRTPAIYGTVQRGEFLNVWCGEYGVDGNGRFCTKTCGWRYALKATR